MKAHDAQALYRKLSEMLALPAETEWLEFEKHKGQTYTLHSFNFFFTIATFLLNFFVRLKAFSQNNQE